MQLWKDSEYSIIQSMAVMPNYTEYDRICWYTPEKTDY